MATITILEVGRRTVKESVEEIKELLDDGADYIKVNLEYRISSIDRNEKDRIQHEPAYIFKWNLIMFE